MDHAPTTAPRRLADALPEIGLFVIASTLMTGLLLRLTFDALAASFDAGIYVRSLWGVLHGEWHNPLVDIHLFGIHGNWILFVLAPLASVLHPGVVLSLGQGLAFGATATLVFAAVRSISADAGRPPSSAAVLGVALLVTLAAMATPLVINPFLFDARPDLIGVPLLLAGLLRMERLGRPDARAVAWMLSSLLVREDYMMVIVGALATAPLSADLWRRRREAAWPTRLAGMALAVGYWGLYWFGIRRWVDAGSFARASQVSSELLDETIRSQALSLGAMAMYKAEIVVVALLAGGLLAVRGWRWIGAAAPGLLFLLLQLRMQDQVLDFHYGMFAGVGLLVAVVAGARAMVVAGGPRRRELVAMVAAATALHLASSAAPTGGRYVRDRFEAVDAEGKAVLTPRGRPVYESMHALVAEIPRGVPAAVPFSLAAPVADRAGIEVTEAVALALHRQEPLPDLRWIALYGRDFESLGARLVGTQGFHLVRTAGVGRLALLTREPVPTAWASFSEAALGCRPLASWPAVGVRLCGVSHESGWLLAGVERAEGAPSLPGVLDLLASAESGGAPELLRGYRGLLPLSTLPGGRALQMRSLSAVPSAARWRLTLVLDGRPVPCVVGDGQGVATPGCVVEVGAAR